MLPYLTRGQVAVGAALALPPAACAVLVPFRADMSGTNTVLVLVGCRGRPGTSPGRCAHSPVRSGVVRFLHLTSAWTRTPVSLTRRAWCRP